MQEEKKKNSSCLKKIALLLLVFSILAICIFFSAGFWLYNKVTKTNDLAVFLGKKLSRQNKYSITIGSFTNTLPIITANNVCYETKGKISSLSVNIGELAIYPNYYSPKVGTHSFLLSSASMHLKRPNFLVDSKQMVLSCQYNPKYKQIFIASSAIEAFSGKLYISGNIDTNQKPSNYDLSARLVYLKLEDILKGTKNNGRFSGDIYGTLRLFNLEQNKKSFNGEASLSITNGSYNKPELFEKVCSALKKIGLESKLREFAMDIASGTFSMAGDFKIKSNSYETNNCEIKHKFGIIKFKGVIGPKSAINGAFRVKIKSYSDFEIKANGPDNKNMKYEISDSDKARIASIILREASKVAELTIKEESKRFNRKLNDTYESSKDSARDAKNSASKRLKKVGNKIKNWFK